MTIKQLFAIMEQANNFNNLLGERKQNHIGIRIDNMFSLSDDNDNKRFYNFKEFKKVLKNELTTAQELLEADFTQDEQYKNYFNYKGYELGIFEENL